MNLRVALPAIACAYLLGAVPFSLLLARILKGVDLRAEGSGNVGATNLGRVCGWRWFPVAFGLDFAKGLLPPLALAPLVTTGDAAPTAALATRVALALAPVLGHIFNPFLGMRGGKGVATGAGALAALIPVETAIAAGIWLAAFAVTRTVGVASSAAAAALPVVFFFLKPRDLHARLVLGGLCVTLAVLILWRHRTNLRAWVVRGRRTAR